MSYDLNNRKSTMFASSSRWPITPFLVPKTNEISPKTHLSIITPSRSPSPHGSIDATYTRSPSPVGSASSKTFAFFSSSHSASGSEDNPLFPEPVLRGRPEPDGLHGHTKPRSLTEDFFSSPHNSFSYLPTPPTTSYSRSGSSKGSRDPSPSDREVNIRSRLFPSRGNTEATRERHYRSPGKRDFVELESLDTESAAEPTPHPSNKTTAYFEDLERSNNRSSPTILSQDLTLESPAAESVLGSTKFKITLIRSLGHGTFSNVWLASECSSKKLVAVKIAPRPAKDTNDVITRLTFEREAQVLTHISHERILPILYSSSSISSTFLVLEYIPGGDLLDLVNDDERYAALSEDTFKAMAQQLIGVVGWLHSEGIVHRDVKLENVMLLTALPLFPTLGLPMIKLSDFGFARFIDLEEPLLTTRCGSEAYAAPELILGGGQHSASSTVSRAGSIKVAASNCALPISYASATPSPSRARLCHRYTASGDSIIEIESEGWYDGRETDAWAVGAVLFALLSRTLPFGEGPDVPCQPSDSRRTTGRIMPSRERNKIAGGERERRSWLLRIAKGEWTWPDTEEKDVWDGARNMVGRLLLRSRRKRATLQDVWGDEWLDSKHTWEEEMRVGHMVDKDNIDEVVWQEVN